MAHISQTSAMSEATSSLYTPKKEDKFSFGLWTVGNSGGDAYGASTRPPLKPAYLVEKLAELGAWGVNFQDDDLVAFDPAPGQRRKAAEEFKQLLADYGMVASMATTSLFTHAAFKEGAFSAVDPTVRDFALQKTLRAIDFAAEVGAPIFDLWAAREGADAEAAKDPALALGYIRRALNFLCEYVISQGYDLRFALEPKPNEPRGDSYLPTAGHQLAFISTLEYPAMVGLNPEVAHETIATLNFYHEITQVLEAGKLFHIDLNDQKSLRFDQNFRFASENLKNSFFLVKLLEEQNYSGPRHFDVHPYRTDGEQGVWDCALACMHNYNLLKEKAKRFALDSEIQGLLAEIETYTSTTSDLPGVSYNREAAQKLKNYQFDLKKLEQQKYAYSKLDQLTIELILGVR